MKKVVFLFSLFVLLSCSSSDESINSSDFNPPAWIQGTWVQLFAGQDAGTGVRFGAHDLCLVIGTGELCQQGIINSQRAAGGKMSVIETITSTSYSVIISSSAGSNTFSFRKISDTKIEWTNNFGTELSKR